MKRCFRLVAIGTLAIATPLGLGFRPGLAASHPHVYLFRGLADVFSTGMDTLADELSKHGVHATSHSHTDWKAIADRAAADYKAKKEGQLSSLVIRLALMRLWRWPTISATKESQWHLWCRLTVHSRFRRQEMSLASSILLNEITLTYGQDPASAARLTMWI